MPFLGSEHNLPNRCPEQDGHSRTVWMRLALKTALPLQLCSSWLCSVSAILPGERSSETPELFLVFLFARARPASGPRGQPRARPGPALPASSARGCGLRSGTEGTRGTGGFGAAGGGARVSVVTSRNHAQEVSAPRAPGPRPLEPPSRRAVCPALPGVRLTLWRESLLGTVYVRGAGRVGGKGRSVARTGLLCPPRSRALCRRPDRGCQVGEKAVLDVERKADPRRRRS